MPINHFMLFGVGLTICLLTFGIQGANAQNVCTALVTPDGFVALRAAPSARAQLIVRMRPGDMVVIERHLDFPSGYVPVRTGPWLRASHYVGEIFPRPGDPEFRKVMKGWVHTRLVDECG
jgi:hypothetical protein